MQGMMSYSARRAYGGTGREAAVLGASPVDLVVMLYDGALDNLRVASELLQQGKLADKGLRVGKAIDIVNELKLVLDHERGGEISKNLDELYAYMVEILSRANAENNPDRFGEVVRLLSTLREAWGELAQRQARGTV